MCFNHLYDETLREQAAVTTLVQLSQDVRERNSGHDIRLWAVTGPETFEQKTSAKQAYWRMHLAAAGHKKTTALGF